MRFFLSVYAMIYLFCYQDEFGWFIDMTLRSAPFTWILIGAIKLMRSRLQGKEIKYNLSGREILDGSRR